MNKKLVYTLLGVVIFVNAQEKKLDLSKLHARRYVIDSYDCETYHVLCAHLHGKNELSKEDKEYILHLLQSIKKEYAPIKERWSSCFNWPIKPLEEVSWNDMKTYLSGKDGCYNALSASTSLIARY